MPNLSTRQRAEQVIAEWLEYANPVGLHPEGDKLLALRDMITTALTIAVAEALEQWGQHKWKCSALAHAVKVGKFCTTNSTKQATQIAKTLKTMPANLPCDCGLDAARKHAEARHG